MRSLTSWTIYIAILIIRSSWTNSDMYRYQSYMCQMRSIKNTIKLIIWWVWDDLNDTNKKFIIESVGQSHVFIDGKQKLENPPRQFEWSTMFIMTNDASVLRMCQMKFSHFIKTSQQMNKYSVEDNFWSKHNFLVSMESVYLSQFNRVDEFLRFYFLFDSKCN